MKYYRINPDYMLRELAGEYVIIPVGENCSITNAVMTPNQTAVFIWKFFEQPATEEAAVKKALEMYEGPEEAIRQGIHGFIEESLKYGILREEG